MDGQYRHCANAGFPISILAVKAPGAGNGGQPATTGGSRLYQFMPTHQHL